jgi:hypothetical protein
VRAHLSGVRVDSDPGVWGVYNIGPASYVVKTGDKIAFRMYQHNAAGKISMGFTDGSNSDWYSSPDGHGDSLGGESTSDAWVNRVVDVGSFAAGRTLSYLFVEDAQGAPLGSFDVAVADMVIVSIDGTVTTLVGPGSVGSAPHDCGQIGGTGPTTCVTERVTNQADFPGSPQNTIYNLGDHLGTAQMEFVAGGWPVWQGQFAPFGGELDSQATTYHYKFTGKERDTESGLDNEDGHEKCSGGTEADGSFTTWWGAL